MIISKTGPVHNTKIAKWSSFSKILGKIWTREIVRCVTYTKDILFKILKVYVRCFDHMQMKHHTTNHFSKRNLYFHGLIRSTTRKAQTQSTFPWKKHENSLNSFSKSYELTPVAFLSKPMPFTTMIYFKEFLKDFKKHCNRRGNKT